MFTVIQARKFIDANLSFFMTPIKDNQAFGKFYQKNLTLNLIADYSSKLTGLLYPATQPYGKGANISVIYAWKEGNFEPALLHSTIRQFLYDNRNHPALTSWNAHHAAPLDDSLAILPTVAPVSSIPEPVAPQNTHNSPILTHCNSPRFHARLAMLIEERHKEELDPSTPGI